jgi:hypothetical protein
MMSTMIDSRPGIAAAAGYPVRTIGFWLAVALTAYILFNAWRALSSPAEFAATFGTPLRDTAETSFVTVYAIRALFLGAFSIALLATRRFSALAAFVLVGIIMPVGDALLVASAGAPSSVILRHVIIAVLLAVTWFFLRRTAAASQQAG